MKTLVLAASLVLVAACGGSTGTVDGPLDPGSSSGGSGSGSEEPGASSGSPGSSGSPQVTLALRGSTAAVAHLDTFSGQTPTRQIVAVKSLWLYKSASDPNPLKVVDLGTNAVETDLVTGKTNDVATVSLKSLPAGTYTIAKVGAAYVRYSVAARMHNGVDVDGRYDNVQALSDGVMIDGTTRAKGWYRYSFAVGASTLGTVEGAGAPLPQVPASGGMTLETSGADAFYVFPMHVTIDPNEPKDQRIVCEVNVHESFRWQDQAAPGYASHVYDTTPSSSEPVIAFGASAFSLLLEPK